MDIINAVVGVLAGGISSEREISLLSGTQAFEALRRRGVRARYIDITSAEPSFVKNALAGIDIAFIALHGEFGEDGGIQKILQECAIPYTGSEPQASYAAMDKIASKNIFRANNIATPLWTVVSSADGIQCGLPAVVKPYLGGSSLGVSIVRQQEELARAVNDALVYNNKILIEEYVAGRELTVGIFDQQALPVIEIKPTPAYFDFTAKYSDGLVSFEVPAHLNHAVTQRVQDAACRAHQALGCRHFSRVDIILDAADTPCVLEVNTIPGLTSHSLLPLAAHAQGIAFDDLVVRMIEMAVRQDGAACSGMNSSK